MVSKKTLLTFTGIYLFLYIFNYLHPMNFGDDYIYSFVWQGNPMMEPLPENANRISSFKELFISQWSHYFTWSGRTVGHVLAQFFLWMGKDTFNFFNALIGTLLVAEIYWLIHKGEVSYKFNTHKLCWIFFLLWAFTPGFSSVFLWFTAACVYLWTHTLLLAFLIPFVRKYYRPYGTSGSSFLFRAGVFFGGILAGWTNENSICWVLLLLLLFNYKSWKNSEYESWMGTGFSGLLIGYALLMLAPGNVIRLQATYGMDWFGLNMLKVNLHMLIVVLTIQLFLWYFNLRAIYSLKNQRRYFAKDYLLVSVLCATAFGTTAMMILSPVFPARSGFFGTILLIIAAGVLLRIQDEHKVEFMRKELKKVLFCLGALYFAMTVAVSLNGFYKMHLHMQDITVSAQRLSRDNKETILTVSGFKEASKLEDMMSGFHIPIYELSEDEKDWKNVDFSRYYKIKGIRMLKETDEK